MANRKGTTGLQMERGASTQGSKTVQEKKNTFKLCSGGCLTEY